MESTLDPRPQDARYGAVAQTLHWLVALLIVVIFAIGLYMVTLQRSPLKFALFQYHKWIGIGIGLLLLLRLAWRLTHRPPPLPLSVPPWQRRAARVVHGLLYLFVFAVPLSGWLMSSAEGRTVVWLDLVRLPDLVAPDEALGEQLEDVHWWLNKTLLALVVLHVAAAVQHLLRRDTIVARMLPARWGR